jgi:citrate synthase
MKVKEVKLWNECKLILRGNEYELPVIAGREHEVGIDIRKLRERTGALTYDPGFGNTGSCKSSITYIDGEKGILRYRGYPIETLAGKFPFSQIAYLLIYGELPTPEQAKEWRRQSH